MPSDELKAALEPKVEWWLVELSQYGYASRLADGPHSDRVGVENALYLFQNLACISGMKAGRRFACARVELAEVTASAKGISLDAVRENNKAFERIRRERA